VEGSPRRPSSKEALARTDSTLYEKRAVDERRSELTVDVALDGGRHERNHLVVGEYGRGLLDGFRTEDQAPREAKGVRLLG
jgi:hypothetical protein